MNSLINTLTKLGLLKDDLDYHLIRASMVIVFLFFGYQKWFEYEAERLLPYISNALSATNRRRIIMLKHSTVLILSLFMVSANALADDTLPVSDPLPPGLFTSSNQSDDWKIKNALSAAPEVIAEKATVIDWPKDMFKSGKEMGRILRKGSNGWTCMPDVPGRPQHDPMCADETMMKWLTATLAGKKPDIDRVGLSYMLLGEARQGQGATPAKDPGQVKEWFYVGPHIMVVLPDSAKDALRGINQDLSNNQPYISFLSSADVATPIWVIPVAKGGDRIKEEAAK